MPNVVIRFALSLAMGGNVAFHRMRGEVGFHRWFPNGQHDAIVLPPIEADIVTRVWFDRSEIKTLGLPEEESALRAGNDAELARHGILWSGPLRGEVKLSGGFAIAFRKSMSSESASGENGVEATKMVVRHALGPSLRRLISHFRYHLGHYWIDEEAMWDGTEESLGNYCARLNLHREGTDSDWQRLPLPQQVVRVRASSPKGRECAQYISRDDWNSIPSQAVDETVSMAMEIACRSLELEESGLFRYALMEAIVALELGISERVRKGLGAGGLEHAGSFLGGKRGRGLNLKAKVVVCGSLSSIDPVLVSRVVEAVDLRNAVAHEGAPCPDKTRYLVRDVIRFTTLLLGWDFRFVRLNSGSMIASPEVWAEELGKS